MAMTWEQMMDAADIRNKPLMNRFRAFNPQLALLIKEHGIDWQGVVKHVEGLGKYEDGNTFNEFVRHYGGFLPQPIEASEAEIDDLLNKYNIEAETVLKFANLKPKHLSRADWYSASPDNKDLVDIFKNPEFRKEALARNLMYLPWMPDLSREDAEYLVGINDPYDVQYAIMDRRAPKEFVKAHIRRSPQVVMQRTSDVNHRFHEAISEMLDTSDREPAEVEKFLYNTIVESALEEIHNDDHNGKYNKLLKRVPPEVMGDIDLLTKPKVIKRLQDADMTPEQNRALDEIARKDPINAAVRFISSGRAEELSPSEIEGIMRDHVSQQKKAAYSRYNNYVSDEKMAMAIGMLPKESIDRLIEENKNSTTSYGDDLLAMWKYTNRYGETPSDESFQASVEAMPSFRGTKFNVDHQMRLNGAKNSFITPKELMEIASAPSVGAEGRMQVLTHPNVNADIVRKIGRITANVDPDFERVVEGMGGDGVLSAVDAGLPHDEWEKERRKRLGSILDGTHGTRTDVRVGSTALRHLRDHLDQMAAQGVASVRPEDLPKGKTFNTITRAVTDKKGNVQHVLDWAPLRDGRAGGNITSAKVTEAIDAMPVRPLMVRQSDLDWYSHNMQNHSSKGTHVLQFMPTVETLEQIKNNGLHSAFAQMSLDHMEEGTKHPTAPFHLGWCRFNIDHDKKEIFIDEIQSDLYSSFRKLMKSPSNKLKDQMQSVADTLFGKHHPSEIMHEAAHQWFRDQGYEGYKVHIHGVKSKANMSLADQTKEPPVHFKEGYGAIPKKMGYTPAKYGDLSIETGDGSYGADRLKGMDTHGSKIVKFEELLFELAKGEW